MSAGPDGSVTSRISMDPGEEAAHGPGEEDDEGPSTPWLPPDDRLWRHPSEVRSNPTTPEPVPPRRPGRWFRGADARPWLIGATSGVVAALVCAGILMAAGAVDQPTTVTTHIASTGVQATTRSTAGSTPNLPAIFVSVEPSVVGLMVNGDSGVQPGSGVVVSSSGPTCYILTDSSLFTGASSSTSVQVMSYLGQQVKGHLIGTDPSDGIAVVRADLCVRTGRYPAVTTAQLGTVADVQTGEEVYSIGSTAVAATTNGARLHIGVHGRLHELSGPRERGVQCRVLAARGQRDDRCLRLRRGAGRQHRSVDRHYQPNTRGRPSPGSRTSHR